MSSRHVRCASDSSRICASQGFDAKCHNRKSPSYSITSSTRTSSMDGTSSRGRGGLEIDHQLVFQPAYRLHDRHGESRGMAAANRKRPAQMAGVGEVERASLRGRVQFKTMR
jgi:hypothetical protein